MDDDGPEDDGTANTGAPEREGETKLVGGKTPVLGTAAGLFLIDPFFSHKLEVMTRSMMRETETEISWVEEDEVEEGVLRLGR